MLGGTHWHRPPRHQCHGEARYAIARKIPKYRSEQYQSSKVERRLCPLFYAAARRQIEFDSVTNGGTGCFQTTLEYFQPRGERLPVIVILPMSGGNYQVERV